MVTTIGSTKRSARKKTAVTTAEEAFTSLPTKPTKSANLFEIFDQLINKITQVKNEFENLQKEIAETKLLWEKEQKEYEASSLERNQQEELRRKREQEMYEYETGLKRRIEEDEFIQKKTAWERELEERKAEIEAERAELVELREKVATFEDERQKAIKEAIVQLQKELENKFAIEKKLADQESKAQKELLMVRIENLMSENSRQTKEIESLKKALDEATIQLKEIAVKVIESAKPAAPTAAPTEG